jgi:hypothetical protein
VVLDNHPTKVETKTGYGLRSCAFVVDSEKCSEHVRQVFSGDPDALVLDLGDLVTRSCLRESVLLPIRVQPVPFDVW